MININIEKEHSLGKVKALEAVKGRLERDPDDLEVAAEWTGSECKISGEGIHGRIVVEEDKVVWDMSFSILVRTLGFSSEDVENDMRNKLDEALA